MTLNLSASPVQERSNQTAFMIDVSMSEGLHEGVGVRRVLISSTPFFGTHLLKYKILNVHK